jgi:hypothetical protein
MPKSPEVSGKKTVPQVKIEQFFEQTTSKTSQNLAVNNKSKQKVPNLDAVVITPR